MRRAGTVAGLLLGLTFASAGGQAGEIQSNDANGRSLLQQRASSLLASLKATSREAESSAGSESSEWLDTRDDSRPNARLIGNAWARAALIISDLATLFGARGDNILTQTGGQGYYVGVGSTGGTWSDSISAAQSVLMRLLLADNLLVPDEVRDAIAAQSSGSDIDALVKVATEALQQTGPIIATGSSVTFTLTSTRFGATGTPTVYAPPGMRVARTERSAPDSLSVTMDVGAAAATGAVELRAFNPNSSFLAADTFKLFVIAGSGDVPALADDHPAARTAATLLTGSNDGEIGAAGDEDLFRVDITARGTLTVTTSGPTDVVLALEDTTGTRIAADDDSAGWYNARLMRAINPGTFYVRVRHAASGTGRYTLRSDFVPD
jgi:hypothetical protein